VSAICPSCHQGELARLHHPDAGGDTETMARLNRANEQSQEERP